MAVPTPVRSQPQGWQQFIADGVEVWLPPTYVGGATTAPTFDAVVAEIRRLGRSDIAEIVQANRNAFLLFAADISGAGTLFFTRENVPSGVTAEQYIDFGLQRFASDLRVESRTTASVDSQPAVLVTTLEVGTGSKNHRFVTKVGGAVWAFVYTSSGDAFAMLAPTFQRSAETIRFR
jgi:hypothetical protein